MALFKYSQSKQKAVKQLPSLSFIVQSLRNRKPKQKRSPRWDELQREIVQRDKSCKKCGSATQLQVHHIVPFHVAPELELERSNCITLCMGPGKCHFNYGHLGNWHSYNPELPMQIEHP